MSSRVRGFVGGWAEKNLSCAVREVLLKANSQSVPTYPMACFKLPPAACKKLMSAVSNYWWGCSLDNHNIHWLSWEKLTRPKCQGGMGFTDFPLFNQAMLGKQGWRLMTRPELLCAKVLKGKYYPSCDFLSAAKKKRSLATWRAILHGRDVLKRVLIRRVGPGDINIWQDNWIPGLRSLKPAFRLPSAYVEKVCDLFVLGTRVWNTQLVMDSFLALDGMEVLKVKPSERAVEDVLARAFEKHGTYSVPSAYRILKEDQTAKAMAANGEAMSSGTERAWQAVWKLRVPPKVRVFWWCIMHNSLPSKAEMKRRHVAKESHCEMCGDPDETLYHIILFSHAQWRGGSGWKLRSCMGNGHLPARGVLGIDG